jgi:hypothetical protein
MENPYLNVCKIHNDALDYFISVSPSPLTVDNFIEPFVKFACDSLDLTATPSQLESLRSYFKQVLFVKQKYSYDEILAVSNVSDSYVKYFKLIQNYSNDFSDLTNYIKTLTVEVSDEYLPISNKLEVLKMLALAEQSSIYWINVVNDPQNPWNAYPTGSPPTLLDVAGDIMCGTCLGYGGGYGINYAMTGIWGEEVHMSWPLFIIGAAVGSAGYIFA